MRKSEYYELNLVEGTDVVNPLVQDVPNYERIDDTIVSINERTDIAIKQNNDNLLSELGKTLSRIKILNYFTGESVSIQAMFDYLAMLHSGDSIDYDTFISKNKTYDELASLNVKFTDLVLHGNTLIV